MAEKESVFRKQSIESVSSPEQLNDYIKVATPSVWFVLLAVIFLLIGIFVWGIFGKLDTTVTAGAECSSGTLTMLLSEQYKDRVRPGMTLTVGGREFTITAVSEIYVEPGIYDAYALRKAGLSEGDFGVKATAGADLPDGSYSAEVTLDSVSPISFIIN